MSKMKPPSDRKPPLAESPKRFRPRRILRSTIHSSLQIPSASIAKCQVPIFSREVLEESKLRPDLQSMSCEFRDLTRLVEDEFGNRDLINMAFSNTSSANSSPVFERGRFYDAYSARRNERLKRKKDETEEDCKTIHNNNNLGVVAVESGKRRDSKKFEKSRKSVPADFSISRFETPRYSLRSSSSSKENKKPDLSKNNVQMSVVDGDRKVGARRVRKN